MNQIQFLRFRVIILPPLLTNTFQDGTLGVHPFTKVKKKRPEERFLGQVMKPDSKGLRTLLKNVRTGISRTGAQDLFNPQQLVVLRRTV